MDEITKMRIEAILDERRQRRDEILLLAKTFLGFGPLLLTVLSGAFITILEREVSPLISSNRGLILGLLNQLLFFLGVFAVLVFINMATQARYVAHLEERLNHELGQRVCTWESSGLLMKHSAYPYLSAVLFLLASGGFVILTYLTFREVQNYWLLVMNIAQLLIVWCAQIYDVLWSGRKQHIWLSSYMSGKNTKEVNGADNPLA